MTGMSTKAFILGIALLTLGGCVSQGQYDALVTKERRAQEQLVDLQERIASLNAEIMAIRTSASAPSAEMLALLDKLKADRSALQLALDAARADLENLGKQPLTFTGPLPAELDLALKQLADANPELMEYDSRRGMVKLKSDLTFALGSTEINASGAAALQKLASIINRGEAVRYGVRIVGHTDNVPVTNAVNLKRFGDNWGLSAFRSIAVKDVLSRSGVSQARLEIAGRGEFQPVVANGPRGAAANRRVEMFLFPIAPTGGTPIATAGEDTAIIPALPPKAKTQGDEQFK
jgi:chemotaxis protein MotB